MSSPSENKQIVTELFSRLSASDVDGVQALLTDDISWRLPGTPELTPTAGLYDKKRLRRLMERMVSQLEHGLAFTVLHLIAEGDSVAAEVESSGDLKNGRKYRQQYHMLFRLRDGRIALVHEYYDTQHAHDVWIRP
jgi:ketosteroid isomerase-like protein